MSFWLVAAVGIGPEPLVGAHAVALHAMVGVQERSFAERRQVVLELSVASFDQCERRASLDVLRWFRRHSSLNHRPDLYDALVTWNAALQLRRT